MKEYYVYILANKRGGVLYLGTTNDLMRRVYEHRQGLVEGFTKKYCIDRLVYYEQTNDVMSAITREKQIKKWNRKWKIRLIEKCNPRWEDLYEQYIRFPAEASGNDMG